MLSLALYRSYIFDRFRYPSSNPIDYNLLLSHNLRYCHTPPLFFKQLLQLHQNKLFILTPELVDQFRFISNLRMESLDKYSWYEMPEFFNKSGEFYSLLYINYAAVITNHFQVLMANCDSQLIEHTYLYEFYQESALIINELSKIKPSNNDEIFVHQSVVISLVSIYLTIRTYYAAKLVNNVLNNSEISSQLGINLKSDSTIEESTAYYLNLLFKRSGSILSTDIDSNKLNPSPARLGKNGALLTKHILKVGESRNDRLNVKESAEFLNYTPKTVSRYTAHNKLKRYGDGSKKYYLRGELLDYKNSLHR